MEYYDSPLTFSFGLSSFPLDIGINEIDWKINRFMAALKSSFTFEFCRVGTLEMGPQYYSPWALPYSMPARTVLVLNTQGIRYAWGLEAPFTLGVRADVQPKPSIPTGGKVEIGSKGFTPGVKAELEKIFSICPKLIINAELYGLVLAPRLEKGYHWIWKANLQPLGLMLQHSLSWHQCSSTH